MVNWEPWMEDLDHLQSPKPVYARPPGLASLGSNSFFIEPYKIRSPHRVHIGRNTGIGERAFFSVVEERPGVTYDPVVRIGDDCMISTDLFIACVGSVEIGSGVAMSARVFIGDSGRDYGDPTLAGADLVIDEPSPVRIGDGCIIGIGSAILRGVTVGERTFVAAGSVVTRDVPPRCVVFGNPARVVRSWDEEIGEWVAGPPRKRDGGGERGSKVDP